MSCSGAGPSPLTRGNPDLPRPGLRGEGSIPAHAGQPATRSSSACPTGVHPRSRGATREATFRGKKREGPSPLTRGNRDDGRIAQRHEGSISAHAGQPSRRRPTGRSVGVHPRSRGATAVIWKVVSHQAGPSPLTRGNHLPQRNAGLLQGSIPAHAGQPEGWQEMSPANTVHPRSRGATPTIATPKDGCAGPSPLTRGNLARRSGRHAEAGSIPAHAGQPGGRAGNHRLQGVHPRSRGATQKSTGLPVFYQGPSPLTRGNQLGTASRTPTGGSIPAHAGQPTPCIARCRPCRVHPRSRGATQCHPGFRDALQGPSPLTRGNRERRARDHGGDGSIPAHAGQPSRVRREPHRVRVHPRSRGATSFRNGATSRNDGPSPLTRGNLSRVTPSHERGKSEMRSKF